MAAMQPHTVGEIAAAIGAEAEGDTGFAVRGVAEPAEAGPDDLAVAMDPKYAPGLARGQARAAVLWQGADWQGYGLAAAILVARPRYAMAGLTRHLDAATGPAPGIHPMAAVDPTAEIGAGAAIGPFAVVGAGARIGPGARIGAQFIAHPGCVIGGDGFSFVTPEKSGVEEVRETVGHRGAIRPQKWVRIHSLGAVEIGDDVEIGCNTTIDRGTIRATRVGSGTKIDNLVQIGHNVQIGEDCLICGMAGVAGSSRIGSRVVLGAGVGVNDNIFVGDDVIVGGAGRVYTNAPAGRVLMGAPAVRMETQMEILKAIRRLPRTTAKVAELQKTVSKLVHNDETGASAPEDEE